MATSSPRNKHCLGRADGVTADTMVISAVIPCEYCLDSEYLRYSIDIEGQILEVHDSRQLDRKNMFSE